MSTLPNRAVLFENLLNTMNSLDGITVSSYRTLKYLDDQKLFIAFYVMKSNKGLFFLTRCVDNRYWEHGDDWSINLSVGDNMINDHLPISYCLESIRQGDELFEQINSLLENFDYHKKNVNFVKLYGLSDTIAKMKTYITKLRNLKINKLLEK